MLMALTDGTVYYSALLKGSAWLSVLEGFPLFLKRKHALETTREADGVFSSHGFLAISESFQAISKELKSKFR